MVKVYWNYEDMFCHVHADDSKKKSVYKCFESSTGCDQFCQELMNMYPRLKNAIGDLIYDDEVEEDVFDISEHKKNLLHIMNTYSDYSKAIDACLRYLVDYDEDVDEDYVDDYSDEDINDSDNEALEDNTEEKPRKRAARKTPC